MSTNPYAQAAGPTVSAASPEEQQRIDYELAVGPNTDYDLPKFERFDVGGSKVGWQWPAVCVTSWWFIYRKMFGLGILNLCVPLIVLIVSGIAAAAKLPDAAVGVLAFVLLVAPSFLFSMFASALYWRHVQKVIRTVPRSIASQPDKRAARIERNGGTGVGPMIAVMLGVLFFGGSIGAGVAIPAKQD